MNVDFNAMETPMSVEPWKTIQYARAYFPELYKAIIDQCSNNVAVQADSDSHEDAGRSHTKSLKRGQLSDPRKLATESDSFEIAEKKVKQPVVVEDDGEDNTTTYAIQSENPFPEGLVLGQSSKEPQETSYPPSTDVIVTESYENSFDGQLTTKSSHKDKVNFSMNHHNHQNFTETEIGQLSHIYHAYHCPKLQNYNCTLVQCAEPRDIIEAVEHNICQKFVTSKEGNVSRECINSTYKLLVFHAQNCTNRSSCKMPLCQDWDDSLNQVLNPNDDTKKSYMVIHSSVPAYAVSNLFNGTSLKTLLSVHIDKGTFGNISQCLMEDKTGRRFTTVIKRIGIQDQNVSRLLATSLPILKRFSNLPNILVPNLIARSNDEVLMFMPKADISLVDYLRSYEGGMPPDATAYYFFQIAKGVKSIHVKDHVHGDIKVANCLLFNGGKTVKVCDLDSIKEERTVQASGSRHYVDPEVLKTRHVRKSSDVYSLCQCLPVLLFGGEEILTKHHPNDLYNMIKGKDVDLAEVYCQGTLYNTDKRITASELVGWFRSNVKLCTRRKNFKPKELPTSMLPSEKNVCKHALKGYFTSVMDDYPKGFKTV